ncbi:hypothetical protein GCM10007425_31340 [Lysinibacillus alkalisoli]|uniref:DUF5067 domain-containing protein n=1 Tax=Lysinibacillus alkalisoli TaxID=1911548 RepID=A0A917GAY7_9BACI|nr:DUF5067 domain-containing protein [Lysinibacillus alkalisoli]GGG34357.1 hypothetical protein GCM10007425_31340 [Lysinibacillus alkalisoli]
MKKVIYSAALVASLIGLSACGETEKEKSKDENIETSVNNEETTKEDKKEDISSTDVYFKDGEVKIEDLSIKIKETKVIPVGEPGNEYGQKPVFAIWYDTTNLSDKDIDPITSWMAVFSVIQDNDPNAVNKLNVGMLPDQNHLDSQMESIKKDGTVENSIAYELDDLETPVTLVARQGLVGKELGKQDFEVK